MIRVGLTGNMGSGKTTVCKVFEILGAPVFYADTEAKKLFSSPEIQQQVEKLFGREVFANDGTINTKALGAQVFTNAPLLKKLNAIIHPAVYDKFEQWASKQQNSPYIIQEAAILFETGSYQKFHYNILVYAPENLLVERVIKRDQLSREQVLDRLSHQMDQEAKKVLADWIVVNDDTTMVIPQVLAIHKDLTNR